MNTKMTLLAAALAAGMFAGSANAAAISCNVVNAMANASIADECAGDNAIGANPASETTFVNTNFQDGGDPFFFVDKTGEASTLAGFVLTVTSDATTSYLFDYTLAVPDEWIGEVVDWVLVIKQTSAITIAYLFEDVTLGISGGFNNFYINNGNNTVNNYSHASGLLRLADGGDDCLPDDPDCGDDEIPEPGVLFLMGAGLLGLGLARRRKSA